MIEIVDFNWMAATIFFFAALFCMFVLKTR